MKNGIIFQGKIYCLQKLPIGLLYIEEVESSYDFSTVIDVKTNDDLSFFNANELGLVTLIKEYDMIIEMSIFFKDIAVYADKENHEFLKKNCCDADYIEDYVFITDGLPKQDSDMGEQLVLSFLTAAYSTSDLFDILSSKEMKNIKSMNPSDYPLEEFEKEFSFIGRSKFLEAFKEVLSRISFDRSFDITTYRTLKRNNKI